MFTGIIDHCGIIEEISDLKQGKRFAVKTDFNDLVIGESIAVDGACLTVTQAKDNRFNCDLSPETLSMTRLSQLRQDSKVNLERSLRLNDRLSGHFVSGHVDQTASVADRQEHAEFLHLTLNGILSPLRSLLIKKGSVCVNGVSLTVNTLTQDGFTVMLIPETLARTNLGDLMVGDVVNLEYDMLVKTVQQQLKHLMDFKLEPLRSET